MTENQARLRIVARMRDNEGVVHETKNARKGVLKTSGGSMTLSYDDVQDSVKAKVLLSADAKGAQMRRMGEMTGMLNFEPGKRTSGLYATMYGEIPVAVYTRTVKLEQQENGGELKLDYDVFVGGEKTSSADMTITWRV